MARKRRKIKRNPRRTRRVKTWVKRVKRHRRKHNTVGRGFYTPAGRAVYGYLKSKRRKRNPPINSVKEFKEALKNGPYAWPGGYPVYFVTSDGAALSFEAAKKERKNIIDSIKRNINDGWRVAGVDVNWEDSNLYCDHTGKKIESAYGE